MNGRKTMLFYDICELLGGWGAQTLNNSIKKNLEVKQWIVFTVCVKKNIEEKIKKA